MTVTEVLTPDEITSPGDRPNARTGGRLPNAEAVTVSWGPDLVAAGCMAVGAVLILVVSDGRDVAAVAGLGLEVTALRQIFWLTGADAGKDRD